MIAAIMAGLLVPAGPGFSQEAISVQAALLPGVVSVGQEGSYSISVSGARVVDAYPKLIEVPGLAVIFVRNARRFEIRQGRSVQRIELVYSVSAQGEGSYTIPSQAVSVDGRELRTEPVVLTVQRDSSDGGGAEQKPRLRLEVPKNAIYLGEVIPVSLVVEIPAGSQFRPMEHPKLNPEGFALKRFAVPVPGGHRDGWAEYRYESAVSAIRAGVLPLGAAELAFAVSVPPQRVGRTPFASRWQTENYRMQSDVVEIEVKPLPLDGVPPGFQGAVGNFAMAVSASPTDLRVNDPLVIDCKITGTGNFDRLTAPVLVDLDGWKLQQPREYMENRSNGLLPGTTAFSQVAQPLRVLPELPPLEFSFFDPDAATYRSIRSQPIALNISPDENPSRGVEGKDFSAPMASVPEEELGDILTVFEDPGVLWKLDGSDVPAPWAYHLTVVIAAVAVACIAVRRIVLRTRERRRQRLREARQRRRRPFGELIEELQRGGKPAKEFYALARDCISALRAEHGERVREVVAASEELRRIESMAAFYRYGSSVGKAAEAVNHSEQERVLRNVQHLSRELRQVAVAAAGPGTAERGEGGEP